ncbi:tumor necrosis factor receptor superfamily member 4 isoform X2 [Tupaia chinensis]|uniref:tumor necrosis factor receptor superfamily member 4 isoform X2 n=1 Tax=Tupaia chinensis TaxID=246437 RepID=UPI000FFB4C45|nr:tumor necrosis factor receptor superfamily member 4 isoform X2 [Tupaia chinensis]
MRMCVGALPPCSALLLLGLMLGAAVGLDCVGDTYPNSGRCCHECQPGNWMVSRCDHTRDTVCLPCDPGFYNEVVNYYTCKPCTQCNQRSGSELKQNCTSTRDTVCLCRPGTQPLESFKPGVDCTPCPPGHFSPGNNQVCRPWTNCTLAGKRTLHHASPTSDAVCEDRSPPATLPLETESPPARPTTAQPTSARPMTSQGLGTTTSETPKGGNSFRTPIQEEHTDVHSTLAKI